jgi:hypothetical protein
MFIPLESIYEAIPAIHDTPAHVAAAFYRNGAE